MSRVYTRHAVFHIGSGAVRLVTTFGITADELAQRLDAPLVRHIEQGEHCA